MLPRNVDLDPVTGRLRERFNEDPAPHAAAESAGRLVQVEDLTILDRALAMCASTPSVEDIVDRALVLVLEAIGARLCPAALPAR